jgi:lipoate-protein ligase A
LQLYKARAEGRNLQADTPGSELLAMEEALLDYCEENEHPGFLSFWEPHTYFVVLGYGKRLSAEVYQDECHRLELPILRRASGGGTVIQGPGCLNYTLVLPIDFRQDLESITTTNRFIMEQTRAALAPLVDGEMKVEGHTDLTMNGRKFSGNAQRRKRRCLLFHGSFLLNFDLELIYRTLLLPQQQPDYRKNRPHSEFITNLALNREEIEEALKRAWNVSKESPLELTAEISNRTKALVENKYGRDEWNRRT